MEAWDSLEMSDKRKESKKKSKIPSLNGGSIETLALYGEIIYGESE